MYDDVNLVQGVNISNQLFLNETFFLGHLDFLVLCFESKWGGRQGPGSGVLGEG